jgi:hypothetical protein
MSFFPHPSSPRTALRDLLAFMRQRSREQVIGACLALLVTAIIVIEFVVDPQMGTAPGPEVVEVQLYPPNRTDAQIAADQKKDQAQREAQKKADQEQYKQLAKQLHID